MFHLQVVCFDVVDIAFLRLHFIGRCIESHLCHHLCRRSHCHSCRRHCCCVYVFVVAVVAIIIIGAAVVVVDVIALKVTFAVVVVAAVALLWFDAFARKLLLSLSEKCNLKFC